MTSLTEFFDNLKANKELCEKLLNSRNIRIHLLDNQVVKELSECISEIIDKVKKIIHEQPLNVNTVEELRNRMNTEKNIVRFGIWCTNMNNDLTNILMQAISDDLKRIYDQENADAQNKSESIAPE